MAIKLNGRLEHLVVDAVQHNLGQAFAHFSSNPGINGIVIQNYPSNKKFDCLARFNLSQECPRLVCSYVASYIPEGFAGLNSGEYLLYGRLDSRQFNISSANFNYFLDFTRNITDIEQFVYLKDMSRRFCLLKNNRFGLAGSIRDIIRQIIETKKENKTIILASFYDDVYSLKKQIKRAGLTPVKIIPKSF